MIVHQLAALCFRFLAIIIFLNTIPMIWRAMEFAEYERGIDFSMFLAAGIVVLISILLWFNTPWFVRKISAGIDGAAVRDEHDWFEEEDSPERNVQEQVIASMPVDGTNSSGRFEDFMPVGLALLGIWLCTDALLELIPGFWMALSGDTDGVDSGGLLQIFDQFAYGTRGGSSLLVRLVVQFIIGLLLFFGGESIRSYWQRLRRDRIVIDPVE